MLAELATGPGPLPGGGPARPGTVLVGCRGHAERRDLHQRRRDGRALDGGLPAAGRRRGARLHRPRRARRGADPAPRNCWPSPTHAFDRAPADRRRAAGPRGALRPAGPPARRRRCRSPSPSARTAPCTGRARRSSPATCGSGPTWSCAPARWPAGSLLDGDRATGVEVVDLATGERSTITARAVVVAADAWRTPQLLRRLGHPAAGARPIPDRAPADHGGVGAATRSTCRPPHPSTPGAHDGHGGPRGRGDRADLGVSWVPYAADRPFHGQVMQMDASPVPLDPGVTVRPGQVVGLGWFCKKELSPDNRVWFDDDATDEHGLPAIRIDYALSAARRGSDRRGQGPDRRGGAGARPAAGRAVRHASRQLAALPGHDPDGHRRTTARASATPPAASGAPRTSTSAATTSSRPPPPATRP